MTSQLENRVVVHPRRQKKCSSKPQRRYTCWTKTYVQTLTPFIILANMIHIPQTNSPQSRVKKLEYSPPNKRCLAISVPNRKIATTKQNQLERHPICYHKLSLTHTLTQCFTQHVMCRPIKRYLANTKSQAGKDETNRQDTKKRSPETNTQHNKKKVSILTYNLLSKLNRFAPFSIKALQP
jgi:hypothetical protein